MSCKKHGFILLDLISDGEEEEDDEDEKVEDEVK